MGNLPTILDVALAAGVSRQTVSNVLNSPDIVRPDTRTRVESAISELGYRPHASARRLRTQKSSTIGIRLDPMTGGISGSVHDRFLHELTAQADRQQLRILLFTATDPEDEIRQIRRLRDGADVDSFVLSSTFHGDPRIKWLIENGESFVTFGRPWGTDDMNDPQHLWVDVDGYGGVRDATRHLLRQGLRRVGYIGWPSPSGTGDDRRRGWQETMTAEGGWRDADLEDFMVATVDSVGNGADALRTLQARPGGVEGVVCASDALALGARMAGGQGIAVIGFDDTPVAAALGIASVEQQLDQVAAGVLELLTGSHGGKVQSDAGPGSDPRHRLVAPRLVVRDSATPHPGAPAGNVVASSR